VLPVGKDAELSTVAIDPNDYISHVEFYTDDTLNSLSAGVRDHSKVLRIWQTGLRRNFVFAERAVGLCGAR
jgi:hypothetical protein